MKKTGVRLTKKKSTPLTKKKLSHVFYKKKWVEEMETKKKNTPHFFHNLLNLFNHYPFHFFVKPANLFFVVTKKKKRVAYYLKLFHNL